MITCEDIESGNASPDEIRELISNAPLSDWSDQWKLIKSVITAHAALLQRAQETRDMYVTNDADTPSGKTIISTIDYIKTGNLTL